MVWRRRTAEIIFDSSSARFGGPVGDLIPADGRVRTWMSSV
jgi:hypothetical protein